MKRLKCEKLTDDKRQTQKLTLPLAWWAKKDWFYWLATSISIL